MISTQVAAIDDTDRRPLLAVCCVVLALANGAFSLVFSSSKPSLTLAAILVIVMATAFPPAFGARPRPTRHCAVDKSIHAQARSTLCYWGSYFLRP